MKTWIAAILGIIATVWRWLTPSNKWEGKREAARKRLKEIDDELEKVTLAGVEAKKSGKPVLYHGKYLTDVDLDTERERLLRNKSACKSEYDYFDKRCAESR